MDEEEEWPESWDRNKVYMYTDPTGIKVPVPYGFTASRAESEKYVNGISETKAGTLTELNFHSDGDYPWTQNEDNIWISGNKGISDSISELVSDEIIVGTNGAYLNFEWSTSSKDYSPLKMTITNIETGIIKDSYEMTGMYSILGSTYASLKYIPYGIELEKGIYILTITYKKYPYSSNNGLDRGYVKNASLFTLNANSENSMSVHKYGGFVIYEGTDIINTENAYEQSKIRNQFVWVPVEDISTIYEANSETKKIYSKLWDFTQTGKIILNNLYKGTNLEPGILPDFDNISYLAKSNMQGYTKDLLYKTLQNEFNQVILSIKKYGGFYIGRYETGNLSTDIPTVKRLNEDTVVSNWYNIYIRMKNISHNTNVQTGMMYGCLWDETLQWLIDIGDKTYEEIALNSGSWGVYIGCEGPFYGLDGSQINSRLSVPTGYTDRHKSGNIYDLAGNQFEILVESKATADYPYKLYRRHAGGSNVSHNVSTPSSSKERYTDSLTYSRKFTSIFSNHISRLDILDSNNIGTEDLSCSFKYSHHKHYS